MINADELTRIPHNAEVERNTLGVLTLAPERVGEVAELLGVQDFFFSLNRKVFSAILELDSAGKTVDVLTIQKSLARDRELTDAGGIAFLRKLSEGHT